VLLTKPECLLDGRPGSLPKQGSRICSARSKSLAETTHRASRPRRLGGCAWSNPEARSTPEAAALGPPSTAPTRAPKQAPTPTRTHHQAPRLSRTFCRTPSDRRVQKCRERLQARQQHRMNASSVVFFLCWGSRAKVVVGVLDVVVVCRTHFCFAFTESEAERDCTCTNTWYACIFILSV